jgi:hypothetical protein
MYLVYLYVIKTFAYSSEFFIFLVIFCVERKKLPRKKYLAAAGT